MNSASCNRKVLLAFAAISSALVVWAADDWKLPTETAKLKPGPGADLATAQCLVCHSADYISTQPRQPRAVWKASVQKMKDKYGAPILPDKIEALADYLSRSYGLEATNKPGLSPK